MLIWLGVVFSASSDSGSFQRSSRYIGPLVRWLFPHLSDEMVGTIVTGVRKGAHVAEYAVLAWLFWRVVRKPVRHDPRPWSWPHAAGAVLFVALYATTDEIHQTFVPHRYGSVKDVLLDTAGGALGMLVLWAVLRWRRRSRDVIDELRLRDRGAEL